MYYCDPVMSLENLSLVKISSVLWKSNALTFLDFHLLKSLTCLEKISYWKLIEEKLMESLSLLSIPEKIKMKVMPYIRPVGLEVLKWKDEFRKISDEEDILRKSLTQLCFTSQGTVNFKMTAKKLISDVSCDPILRFKLACDYCFESDIIRLWHDTLDSNQKASYCLKKKIEYPNLVQFWTSKITNNLSKIPQHSLCSSIWCYGFLVAFEEKRKEAMEFFWLKLTALEKEMYWLSCMERNIFKHGIFFTCNFLCSSYSYYTSVLHFLFSCAKELEPCITEQYNKLFLIPFLEWPYQNQFLNIAKYANNLTESHYDQIFVKIIHKVEEGYLDFDYKWLFGEFWKSCPSSYTTFRLNFVSVLRLLPNLFKIKDTGNISLILKNLSEKDKDHLSSLNTSIEIFKTIINDGDKLLLTFFMEEFCPTPKKMIRFRDKNFKNSLDSVNSQAYSIISDLILNYDKQENKEENNSCRRSNKAGINYRKGNYKKNKDVNDKGTQEEDSKPRKRVCKRYNLRNLK